MEEIKVGEYVRTKDGRIYQVDNKNDEWALSDIFYKVIVKHSQNIIDIIEVGDIIEEQYGNQIPKIIRINNIEMLERFKNGDVIKSIVTKEQIKQIEYRIKE